jgi:hypothetical protein
MADNGEAEELKREGRGIRALGYTEGIDDRVGVALLGATRGGLVCAMEASF